MAVLTYIGMRYSYRARRPQARVSYYGDDYESPMLVGTTVFELEDCEIPTGILDASGHELVRIEQRNPIGFVHFE